MTTYHKDNEGCTVLITGTMIEASRWHEFAAGHRVADHESKCQHLHGHNYRVQFTVRGERAALDQLGRVMDFGVIKDRLCMWLENEWDHRLLMWQDDPLAQELSVASDWFTESLRSVPFNPTAENMAEYLLNVIGPRQLEGTGVRLVRVEIYETGKCSAVAQAT